MGNVLNIPHRRTPGLCPVNGIRDLVQWRTGRDWSNQFTWGLGQGGGFAYLRFNAADPPRQVNTGIASPRQHRYLAGLLGAGFCEVENRSFKFSWERARAALDAETPPVLGPLDMFHLHYYKGIYHVRHIPIHYVLLVGYDLSQAFVLDTDQKDVQVVPLVELQQAWDVDVPGLGKRNRLAILNIPQDLPLNEVLIRKSIAEECQTMLHPPVSMLGIPAMRKLASEITAWHAELGMEKTAKCLQQVREYLNSPPDLEGNHLTAGRDLYIAFLEEAGEMSGLDFSEPVSRLKRVETLIPGLAEAMREMRLADASADIRSWADEEELAYQELSQIVGYSLPGAPG